MKTVSGNTPATKFTATKTAMFSISAVFDYEVIPTIIDAQGQKEAGKGSGIIWLMFWVHFMKN